MPDYVVEFGKDGRGAAVDGRLDAAAFHRNHQAIWAVLDSYLRDAAGDVLEAGSGTGQHIVHFARRAPRIDWWPSDANDAHLKSIAAWRAHANLPNLHAPQRLDLSDPAWRAKMPGADPHRLLAIFCANVIHIAPWNVAEGLLAGAGRALRPDGRLFLYGPFKRAGRHTAASNAAFDDSLRAGNPDWGVRDLDDVAAVAARHGLLLHDAVALPANNLIAVFSR
ncbi:MAG: class I SAM-dependent methyltransferase [Xanthobacteraceae bacterium]|nr:class I SAM-dependent methyltransferase [Xanthobacteraceae bacterium]